jgi:hypothetical protein
MMIMMEPTDTLERLITGVTQALSRLTSEGGTDNRLVIQGDRGYILLIGEMGEDDVVIKAAAGRSLDRLLDEDEVEKLYHADFRRKNAALPFERTVTISSEERRVQLAQELVALFNELYTSHLSVGSVRERLGDRIELSNHRLTESMRRLSTQRDMSSRQKVYWGVVRSDVLLALSEPPPKSLTQERGRIQWVEAGSEEITTISDSITLQSFKEVTGYRSASIFSDLAAFEAADPRGINWVRLPGRLAISLVLAQGWDSLIINPHNSVGGELYRNELTSIMEGLERVGW